MEHKAIPKRLRTSHLSLEAGYVYIMANEFVPDLLKIGRTTRTPEQRAAELSGTGIPGKWMVKHSIFVPNCEHIEKVAHHSLRDLRVSEDREFFKVEIEKAIEIIEAHSSTQIDDFLGWPNLEAVQAFIDSELKRIKDENDRYAEKIRLEKQLWIIKLEEEQREKAAQEIKNNQRRKLDEIERIDIRTKFTINEANFGWSDIFWILVAIGILVKSEDNPKLHFFFTPVVIIYALILWHRKHQRKLAIQERKINGLNNAP